MYGRPMGSGTRAGGFLFLFLFQTGFYHRPNKKGTDVKGAGRGGGVARRRWGAGLRGMVRGVPMRSKVTT